MSLSNSYLDEQAAKIKAKPVPWEGYQRADLITADDLALIRRIDPQPRSKIDSILLTEGKIYSVLYLRLLKKLARIDTMQYILVLIAEALAGHDERIPLFLSAGETDPELPFFPLIKAMESSDEFVKLSAMQTVSILLSQAQGTPRFTDTILVEVSKCLESPNSVRREIAVQCLNVLLTKPSLRSQVWDKPALTTGLVNLCKGKPSAQMTYELGVCFWLLTFDADIAHQINSRLDIIPLLLDMAQNAAKEKVIRVAMATFTNLVTKAPSENLPAMLVAKVLPYVKSLVTRKFSDEEVIEDVKFLQDELSQKFESLTTYDEYRSELVSGHLAWSPVHDSDAFWRENATKLNEKDNEGIKTLVRILKGSDDALVLAVAAHDIGQYVKHYERGKKILTDLGAKARVMELMSHTDPDVRYQALISVQRLISHSWAST